MSDHFAHALDVLDRLAEHPPVDPVDARVAVEVAHRAIAEGLGLHVFEPGILPYVSVTSHPGAHPGWDRQLFREMPNYTGAFEDAASLRPEGHDLGLFQEGDRWLAAYKTMHDKAPQDDAWRYGDTAAMAVARAALHVRVRFSRRPGVTMYAWKRLSDGEIAQDRTAPTAGELFEFSGYGAVDVDKPVKGYLAVPVEEVDGKLREIPRGPDFEA